jgi:hypothetical protein
LAHDGQDFQDSTSSTGPYIHEYKDVDGNIIGHFSLNIVPPDSSSTAVIVESTGWLDSQPGSQRTVQARMTPMSLTDYAYVLGTGAWIKNDMTIHGKFHANGGIRFDGTTDSLTSSAVETYTCDCFQGCCPGSGGQQTKPGIWGAGGPTNFWDFATPAKDIAGITPKRTTIKTEAQNGGLYLPSSGTYGWWLKFKDDATIEVRKVTWARCFSLAWSPLYHTYDHYHGHYWWWWNMACYDIGNSSAWATYDMPDNNFIYVNDDVWVEGVVNGRFTLAVPNDVHIVVSGDLTYLAKDGNHVAALVAEDDIFIPLAVPNQMEIDAVLVSQNGSIMRHYYSAGWWWWGWWWGGEWTGNLANRDKIITYGSIISQDQWIWIYPPTWFHFQSGFQTTESTYDTNLTTNPPPGFPFTAEYQIVDWEEIIK